MKLNCEVIRTYDEFKKAREHEKKFKYTSDMDTSDVTIQMGRNHPRRKNTREQSSPSPSVHHRKNQGDTPCLVPLNSRARTPASRTCPVYIQPARIYDAADCAPSAAVRFEHRSGDPYVVLSPPSAPFFQTPGIAALLQQNEQLHRKMDAMADDLRYLKIRI
ncbi:hypothetical protein T265_12008 [Opisthorchis viverrini]|uniref:Uncharacterized protein n=1 Tax=Opisthorchis viverrini TaxID=6198 RepID=A0A074Z0V2_OPIVI|nr:hypothetical protein T265_12008 [Opisthorchis viverrini]KER19097.1 hypothetical protein T265_12008 [Opisthorchis viverrini]